MNPFNRPRIVNANIWDKEMADAFSLTHPNQDPNHFDLMHSKLNPESVSTVFAYNGVPDEFSNFSAGAVTSCNLQYPPPRTKSARKKAYQDCLVAEQKKIDEKKASGGGNGILGIGSGRRKTCKESGLTGAEKRQCARELKARGWKKGQPIPSDMAGITPEDAEQAVAVTTTATPVDLGIPAPASTISKKPDVVSDSSKIVLSDNTKKYLLYGGIAVAGIAGILLLTVAIRGALTKTTTGVRLKK